MVSKETKLQRVKDVYDNSVKNINQMFQWSRDELYHEYKLGVRPLKMDPVTSERHKKGFAKLRKVESLRDDRLARAGRMAAKKVALINRQIG